MKTTFKCKSVRFKRSLLLSISVIILLLGNSFVNAQRLTQDVKNETELIAKYAISAVDNTDNYLGMIGYKKPAYINPGEWNAFPSVRKMQLAYLAAERNGNGQGSQFIEAMAKVVSGDYKSIKSEKKLIRHFGNSEIPKITFNNPPLLSDFEKLPVPANIKGEILTIGKYLDEGALGSLQSVFLNYMNLDEETMYDLLARSGDNISAFEQGLLKSKVPPPMEERLSNIATDLQKNYNALKLDEQLSKISRKVSHETFSFVDEEIKPSEIKPVRNISVSEKTGLSLEEARTSFKPSYEKYQKYFAESYENMLPLFENMKNLIRGFGGVIFGDSIKFNAFPVLTELRWNAINDTNTSDYKKIGYMELYFNNNSIKSYGPLLFEDVFAANAIVNDSSYHYGNGIGMVSIIDNSGIQFSNSSRRFGVTLNPAVSHLRLGWAFVVVDALASAHKTFEKVIPAGNNKSLVDSFYNEYNSTWKITDKQLKIKSEGSHIKFDNIAINMWGFRDNYSSPVLSKNFNMLLPTICNNVDEYKRVNDFAKVLAIFRWAKVVKSSISNIGTYNSFIKQPVSVYVDSTEEIKFFDINRDHDAIENEKNYYLRLLEFNKMDTNLLYSKKIDSLLNWYKKISEGREKYWNAELSNNIQSFQNPSQFFKQEDTAGKKLLVAIDSEYYNRWAENNVKFVLPDSLLYYQILSRGTQDYTDYLIPIRHIYHKADSIKALEDSLFLKYIKKLGPRANLNSLLKVISEKDLKYILDTDKKIEALNNRAAELEEDPVFLLSKESYEKINRFEIRHGIVSMSTFYQFTLAEQKIIEDYFNE